MNTRFLSAAALLGLCGLAQAQTTYDYVGAPVAILDGGAPAGGDPGPEAICTVNVSSHGVISDLNANFQINHTWQGDLRIRLVGPLGQTATLVARPGVPPPKFPSPVTGVGFSTDNYGTAGTPVTAIRFIADDEAAAGTIYDDAVGLPRAPGPGTAVATANIAGIRLPVSPLSIFDGTDPFGDWKLIVTDHAGLDTGTINNFAVVITAAAAPSCYADCDHVGGLTGNDFQCFLNAYVAGASYADCDGVGGLTGNDFQCFLDKYVAGCS